MPSQAQSKQQDVQDMAQQTIATLTNQFTGLNLGNETQNIVNRALQQLPSDATRSQVELRVTEQVLGFLSRENPELANQVRTKLPASVISKEGSEIPWVKEMGFLLLHMNAGLEIGEVAKDSFGRTSKFEDNISTVGTRISIRSGLDDKAPGPREGTEVNALRHTIWQAAIASKFGVDIAVEAGKVHENNPDMVRDISSKTSFTTLSLADQGTDLLNNEIGRYIGKSNTGLQPQELALKSLDYFHSKGLWMAAKQSDGTFKLVQTKLPDAEYARAKKEIMKLDRDGLTREESRVVKFISGFQLTNMKDVRDVELQTLSKLSKEFNIDLGGEAQKISERMSFQLSEAGAMTRSQVEQAVVQQIADAISKGGKQDVANRILARFPAERPLANHREMKDVAQQTFAAIKKEFNIDLGEQSQYMTLIALRQLQPGATRSQVEENVVFYVVNSLFRGKNPDTREPRAGKIPSGLYG